MKVIRLIILVIIMMACDKENNDYRSVGTVTGIDSTKCGCCGGWIINIEAWKNSKVNPVACPAVMVYLDQDIIISQESFPANFIIKVKQPDGSYLEKLMK